jgi:predicted metal-dependent hydrolase
MSKQSSGYVMMTKATSPADLVIPVRNLRFTLDAGPGVNARWWLGGDPVATAFFNALSATFPDGERFFMDSVRCYQDRADGPLRSQIRDFIGQEAVHSREHRAFNAFAADAGYDIAPLEERARRTLALGRRASSIRRLAATCALEHFTAILAHALLEDGSADLDGAPEQARRLWSWHAMEELEHKAVAFDTLMLVTHDWWPARRYLLRIVTMIASTILLFATVGANMAALYRQDGLNIPRIWWRTCKYLLGRPGALRRCFRPYLRYYRPGFHPWDHDDRSLLEKTAHKYGLALA